MVENEGKEKNNEKKRKDTTPYLVLIVLIAITVVFFVGYQRITKYRILEEKCKAIESSPNLLYPCRCVPKLKDVGVNKSDVIYKKTEPMCVCTCVIDPEKNITTTIEVRVA